MAESVLAKAAKRSADGLLEAVKEFRGIEETGASVISSMCNLHSRLGILGPKAERFAPGRGPISPAALTGGLSDVLLLFQDVFPRLVSGHEVELEKQWSNLRQVVGGLDGLLLRLAQPVAEVEKAYRKCGAGPVAGMGSPRTPATPPPPPSPLASPSPSSVGGTVPGMASSEVLEACLDMYVFLEGEIARKRLLVAVAEGSGDDGPAALEAGWPCDVAVPAQWARMMEIALRIAGTTQAVTGKAE